VKYEILVRMLKSEKNDKYEVGLKSKRKKKITYGRDEEVEKRILIFDLTTTSCLITLLLPYVHNLH